MTCTPSRKHQLQDSLADCVISPRNTRKPGAMAMVRLSGSTWLVWCDHCCMIPVLVRQPNIDTNSMGADTHTSLHTCENRQAMGLELSTPLPDTPYLYLM